MTNELLQTYPSVFAVGKEYQICALVKSECTMWVEIDGKCYYDHSNGILHSGRFLHIAHVPQHVLDSACEYTLHLRKINERKPYYTDFGDIESNVFSFRPLREKEAYNIINLADTHGIIDEAIKSSCYYGDELDLFVLNGDIIDSSNNIELFKNIYIIAGGVTQGRVPCVFSRGNHDMRGNCADLLAEYTPTDNGVSYYTFHLGPVFGIVLDAGEDKVDDFAEYGHTICCEAFRADEDEFIDRVIASEEYKDAKVRLIISHHPFAYKVWAPFTIEVERYTAWCEKLKKLQPTAWLSGHIHEIFVENPGGAHDSYGYPCPMVCTSFLVNIDGDWRASSAVTIKANGDINVRCVDVDGNIKREENIYAE